VSDQDAVTPASIRPDQRDPDEIREEISRTREDLGETLDALGAKLDMKSQARAKVGQAKTQAQSLMSQTKEQAQAAYRRQPAAVIAGAGAVLALIAGLLIRRARR
jgi:CHASE3 domain sensor protein